MVCMLAKELHWSEHFILWDLPMSRAMQYYHCLAEPYNWCMEPDPATAPSAQCNSLIDFVDNLPEAEDVEG